MRVTYIGHATLLIEVAGVRVITDPNFDPRLAGVLPRVSKPGIALGELPKLDAIVVTHAHADHLSFASLDALPHDIPLFAPPAVARWLAKRGYTHAEAVAPGSTVGVAGLRVTAAAAKHLGHRYAYDRWRSAANMYLFDTAEITAFFAGDTALTPDSHRIVEEHLRERGRELDLALLPIGHAPWWKRRSYRSGHLTYEDALELFERLGARYFIPYHWGTFRFLTSNAWDAIQLLRIRLEDHQQREHVKILEPGQSFVVEKR